MKTKLILASWLIFLTLMATDNLIQGLISLIGFGISSRLLHINSTAVIKQIKSLENRIIKLISK